MERNSCSGMRQERLYRTKTGNPLRNATRTRFGPALEKECRSTGPRNSENVIVLITTTNASANRIWARPQRRKIPQQHELVANIRACSEFAEVMSRFK